ncbi:hypothetical protein [Streptomyces qinglanensis]|uniref:Uncharacterized protein n=1 Tax=Streptomyces qinglanensis TaxID=943816 RepID=A0A1H9WKZ7_9ACTN|nr:hypothetical protein [Streptomyces qinglanensis]SES34514.1 hypothetical protein SAMN05421870_118128 [Streptomyces qinglanensis]
MYLDLMEALGTFFGGLGAFLAATTQLLNTLQKKGKEEERGAGSGNDAPVGWEIPPALTLHLATAA